MDKTSVNAASKEIRRQVDHMLLEIVVWADAECLKVWRVVKEYLKQYAVKKRLFSCWREILGGQGVA